MKSSLRTIVTVVALPPPTHGQAVVNQAIVDALSSTSLPIKVVNTSPGALQKGLSYHVTRMRLHILRAIPAILNAKNGLLYGVVEPGFGIGYNFLTILFARAMYLRIVLHHHSALYTKTFDRRFDWLSRLAGKRTLHVALDEFMAKDIRARYPFAGNVVVAHNASHVAQPILEQPKTRTLTCGFMSNLSREKGLDTFFDCLRAARSTGLDLRAILAGPPTSQEADRMIAAARDEFGDMLEVVGSVSGASKQAFFRSIDVFLFPTRYKVEGQPLVILEAMSYGVPVVATHQGYCAELVGNAGTSAPIANFVTVATGFLTQCHNDVGYLRKMAVVARERYETLKRDADAQMNDLISEICSSGDCILADA
jgi:glycosyltransferase involved in cell wall biosynthesis